jgi:hypothetical protein
MPSKFDRLREKAHTSRQIIFFRTLPNLASGPGQKNRNTDILFDGLPAQTLGHLN